MGGKFQFYLSSIKRKDADLSSCKWSGFNSTLVQLKDYEIGKYDKPFKSFNSTLVQLKDSTSLQLLSEHWSFNSTLVQLKVKKGFN